MGSSVFLQCRRSYLLFTHVLICISEIELSTYVYVNLILFGVGSGLLICAMGVFSNNQGHDICS